MFINIFTLTYILATVILLLSGVLIAIVAAQINLFKKYSEAKKGSDHLRASIIKDEEEILSNARVKAQGIIESALKNASEIESSAEVNHDKQNELLDKKLASVIEAFEKELAKQLEINVKSFNSVSKSFEEHELISMGKLIEQIKTEKIKKLNEKIFEITKSAASEILGGSMTLGAHEELVEEVINKINLKFEIFNF